MVQMKRHVPDDELAKGEHTNVVSEHAAWEKHPSQVPEQGAVGIWS